MPASHEPQQQAKEISLSTRLPRSVRGYDRAATEVLFRELANRTAELERECATLRVQVSGLQEEVERHRAQEQLVSRTLVTATSHATTIKDKAREEAELFLSKARTELERRTEQAERVERNRNEAEQDLTRLRRLAHEMQTGLEGFLTHAMDQLAASERKAPAEPPQPSAPPATLVTALENAIEKERPEIPRNGSDGPGLQLPRLEP